ncbi:hypothetical protein [Paraburkholderia phenoliruptrix]|uniref:hypothetical protein n=1 Tax=Paraburkholderia phenoliruptrix TaxID=252970 RepID=UPI001582C82E|nr:hypothetical protein [Paraburkholderia phenoliruptrix]
MRLDSLRRDPRLDFVGARSGGPRSAVTRFGRRDRVIQKIAHTQHGDLLLVVRVTSTVARLLDVGANDIA